MNLNLYLTPIFPISFCFSAGMLKAVNLPVDLIMAHFNSRRDPEEKVEQGVQEIQKCQKSNMDSRKMYD